jgi:DHA1 family bicyclomycin/chloramphenicol resistance-like MFS transporter
MITASRVLSRAEFVALIAALGTINAAAIDVMLPALPNMGDAFGLANANDRSLVLTVFVIGLGLPQLIFGPLSDRFGRRVPLLAGIVVYALAALAAPFAPNFTALLVLRFIQGVGSAAVSVASQSAVRDLYSGRAMAEIMSMVWSVFMIVPILAPGLGQIILLTGPWQVIFIFMGTLAIICTVWAYVRLPETLAPANRRSLSVGSIWQGFALVFGNRSALFYGAAGVFLFGGVLGLVNSAQQIYVGIYGLGPFFPLAFAVAPITFAIAFLINSRLVARFGMRRLAHGSMVAFIAVTAVWLAIDLILGTMPLWLFMSLLALTVLAQGLAWGNIGSLAMEPLGEVAGTASAVFGSFSTVGAAFLGYGIAQTFNGTTTPVIASFFVFGILVVGCFLIAEGGRLFQPHQAPAAATPTKVAAE